MISLFDLRDQVAFASIHDHDVYKEIPGINFWDCRKTVHLGDENDQVYVGPEVVEYLLDHYPVVRRLELFYKSKLGRLVIKRFYDELNELRKAHTKDCEACQH